MSADPSSQPIPPFKLPQTAGELALPIRNRWSPRAFLDKSVPHEALLAILEAGRWAASCNNEQPWRYLIARREEPEKFAKLLGVLVEKNQAWAKAAPVLMLSVVKRTFTYNNKPNRTAQHDVGAASAQMAVQAASMGLELHQMAGFEVDKARAVFAISEDFEPMAAIALGYPAPADAAPADFKAGELAPRSRKPLAEIAFTTTWGEAMTP